MVSTTLTRKLPLACPSCGSSEISLVYAAPVRVLVRERDVVSVRVDVEQALFSGSARCATCGRRWRLADEPEIDLWLAWEFGA
jgi:DNA-directed RNA polymerase subunit RPC12/RpoP